MLNLYLLFQQPVLRNIPGVSYEYIPSQGAHQAWGLYQKAYLAAWGLLGALMAIAYVLELCGVLSGMKVTWHSTLMRGLLAAVLLASCPTIFGAVIGLGNVTANQIFPQSEIAQLNQQFRDAARKEENERTATQSAYQSWAEMIVAVVAAIMPGTALLSELLLGIFTALFHVAVILIMLTWRICIVTLFCCSPLLLVMIVLPGIGARIGGSWICSLLQLSFWQVLMAVCAFFVRTADGFFQPQLNLVSGRLTLVNHYESMGITLAFALMYLSIPFVAAWLLPISRTSQMAAHGLNAGMSQAAGWFSSAASYGKTAAGGVSGAAAGFQRIVKSSGGGGASSGGASSGSTGGGTSLAAAPKPPQSGGWK